MNDEVRRNMALFSMNIVMKLTELTARQIRYYEQHDLITPERTEGNQRLFSFNDVDRLLQIKSYLEKGINIAGIKEILLTDKNKRRDEERNLDVLQYRKRKDLTDDQVHKLLKHQLLHQRKGKVSLIHGELFRFYN